MGTGILGTRATLVADANLILQITMLIVVCLAVSQAKRRSFKLHCTLMTIVVVANAAAIIGIMNPAFFRSLPFALRDPWARRPMALWPHVMAGTLAQVMGVYVVIAMRKAGFRSTAPSHHLKWAMRITALLWTASLTAGAMLYYVRYM
jgi:hypothetical protein